MKQLQEQTKTKIEEAAKGFFLPILIEKLTRQQGAIHTVEKALKAYSQEIKRKATLNVVALIQETQQLKACISDIIDQGNVSLNKNTFEEDFASFVTAVDSFIQTLPKEVLEVQDIDRFHPGKGDRLLLKIGKFFKKISFQLSQWPVKLGNGIRKLLGRPAKPPKQWHHKIPVQNLSCFLLRNELSLNLLPLSHLIYQKLSSNWAQLWTTDEEIDRWVNQLIHLNENGQIETSKIDILPYQGKLKELITAIEEVKKDLEKQLENILNQVLIKYEDVWQKVGTIEKPIGHFSTSKIDQKQVRLNKAYQKLNAEWHNTFFILFEGWKLDRELYALGYIVSKTFHETKQKLEHKFSTNILPEVDNLEAFLETLRKAVKEFTGDKKSFKTYLLQQRKVAHKQFSDILIPKALDTIFSQNLAKGIDRLEATVQNQTKALSNKRAVIRSNEFDRIIRPGEIDSISPLNLISFETLPNYIKVSSHLKSEVVKKLQDIQLNIKEIDQITSFNLGAALSSLEEDNASTIEEVRKIADEGIGRAITKVQEAEQELKNLLGLMIDQMREAIVAFNDKVYELTEIENVFDLKIRVTKARAIERSKNLRKKIVEGLKNFIPFILVLLRHFANLAGQYYTRITKRFGISQGSQVLSLEISDFLASAQEAVQKLPYVYQKLFEIIPLEEETFFEKRQGETEQLKSAFASWSQGNYSTVLLTGETGAGATSLLNLFLEELPQKIQVIRPNPSTRIHEPEELVPFFSQVLKGDNISNLNDLIHFINQQSTKKIIILEHLQNFFLKKIDGFLCLKMILELIFKTRQNIFWITTLNQYTYVYLNNTLAINDHFAMPIKMAELNVNQITNIILKRHGVSGYKLEFLPGKEDLESKKFQRLTEEGKQQFLKSAYFSSLNKLAGSNIGLALVYWLRSTAEVIEDKIKIRSLKDLDFSFLSSLGSKKVFTLHAILLHGGLTLEEHSAIFHQPESESELILLVLNEDGIIVKNANVYKVNPLLYRPIVNWLKSKNLIH